MRYFNNMRLALTFHTGQDKDNKQLTSTVSIGPLRQGLTDEELFQIIQVFDSLVKHDLVNATLVTNEVIA